MKLGLGTVQFGMNYGVSNTIGKTIPEQVDLILKEAQIHGMSVLDTAAEYGTSEEILGRLLPERHQFKIVTKGFTSSIMSSFYRSLEKLNQKKIYGLLIHDVQNLTRHGGTKLFNEMNQLKARGLVEKIGVSAYTAMEIDRVLELSSVDIVQIPANILDQRLLRTGYLKKLKAEGIEIHARSIFLQGLLLMSPEQLSSHFESVKEHLKSVHLAIKENDLSMLQVALGFVLNCPEIDHVIVGITSLDELREILLACKNLKNHGVEIEKITKMATWNDEKILDPSLWKKNG